MPAAAATAAAIRQPFRTRDSGPGGRAEGIRQPQPGGGVPAASSTPSSILNADSSAAAAQPAFGRPATSSAPTSTSASGTAQATGPAVRASRYPDSDRRQASRRTSFASA